jgi:hypothetical protein
MRPIAAAGTATATSFQYVTLVRKEKKVTQLTPSVV